MLKRFLLTVGAAALAIGLGSGAASAQQSARIAFTIHSSPSNVFWQAVKRGFEDACALVQAECQMVFVQTDGSINEQVANMEAAIAAQPDALITSIVDNQAFDAVIQRARDAGIYVIATNVDDLEGAAGNARQAFIGQGLMAAGESLATAMADQFPADGPINVLIGVSGPGQNWSEQRARGIQNGVEAWAAAHPDREVNIERIDSGLDLAIVADRVGAYLSANPDTTVYFDTGYWHAAVARVLQDRGIEPGKVLLGGFDLVPEVLNAMKSGYIQVEVDQQPYLQGYLPVIMVHLMKNIGLGAWDVDTGQGLIFPDQVEAVEALSAQGLR